MQTETLVLILAFILFAVFLLLIYALIQETIEQQKPNRRIRRRRSYHPENINLFFIPLPSIWLIKIFEYLVDFFILSLPWTYQSLGLSSTLCSYMLTSLFIKYAYKLSQKRFQSGSSSHCHPSSQFVHSAHSSEVQEATYRKLLNLVNGHQETAIRLVDAARAKHPRKSEQWCWEKAIYDLIRDRMD